MIVRSYLQYDSEMWSHTHLCGGRERMKRREDKEREREREREGILIGGVVYCADSE